MSQGVPIQPSAGDPHAEEDARFWHEMGREMMRKSPDALDEVGKQMLTVNGILIGLYTNAIAFSDLGQSGATANETLYLLPIFLLLVSLSSNLLVFFPQTGKIDPRGSEAVRLMYRRVTRWKYWLLALASLALVLAVGFIAIALARYVG